MKYEIEKEVINLQTIIGQNVRKRRKEKDLSQLKLSEEIGQKSTTIISQAELGKGKHFNIEHLYKISKVLECDICDFFNEIKDN